MPERVRIKFEDDSHVINGLNTPPKTTTYSTKPSSGTKRKRTEPEKSHPTTSPTLSQPQANGEEDDQEGEKLSKNANITNPVINGFRKHTRLRHNGISGAKPDLQKKRGEPNPAQHNHLVKRRDALFPFRKALPIFPHASAIRSSLRSKDILLLTGETGSGKSTQVPQFLLSEPWCTGCIAITQPRRVAAISLARRVAEEMGSLLGSASPASKVGYSVRFDNATGPNTKVKFLTEGMLLQEMLRDPQLKQYSAVVVDEVHERSVNVDLILGFMRNLVRGGWKARNGRPLKLVVMSATADIGRLMRFFHQGSGDALSSLQKPNEDATDGAPSEDSWSGFDSSDDEHSQDSRKAMSKSNGTKLNMVNGATLSEGMNSKTISVCYVEGRQYPVKTIYLPEPTQDFVESALKSIFQIHYKEALPGDILVFLTGQDTVESLERLVNEYALGMDTDVPKILALPLFAALPQTAQQRIFETTPPKTRKIILATNIAETSVTVPGVRYVIDSGKVKIKQFRNRLGLDSLLVKPISQSAAIQRKGRAGREAAGQVWRLYTEKDYDRLDKRTTPEILRCDLSAAMLGLKARGVDDVVGFPWLDSPNREALEKALLQLLQLGALTEMGQISDVGLKIAKLPLTPTLGRVLVEAARPERDCVVEIIDIISCLSVENVFLNLVTEEKKEEAEIARRELFRREGDHMTLLTTVQMYAAENTDRRAWAERHFVSHRAMQNVMDIRKQLRQQCSQLKLLSSSADLTATSVFSEARTNAILHCLLRGFAANTARLIPDGSYRTMTGNQTVAIHPSSVLFGKKLEAIAFTEFVFTNKSYARGVSAVQLDWVAEVLAATS